jgi:hypothetical protein
MAEVEELIIAGLLFLAYAARVARESEERLSALLNV